ncbi:MAG: DNA helicase RecQ [Oscillospiraceae bacterium]|nr:DNA helicase RecQ [Oscillospiraceae bacterium]
MDQARQLELLKNHFGYDRFREGQAELIERIVHGADCLGVMPTGGGKSICYQLPALMLDGITLVISPLISLMKDQVGALSQAGISAAYLNSSLTERQIGLVLDNARLGRYKIIYAAPERLESGAFIRFAKEVKISLVSVDEAHCISQWGQDFRPSYLGIRGFVSELDQRPVIAAFTATATARVREDIIDRLELRDPYILVTGFNRANLFLEVQKPSDKSEYLLDFLAERREESGIVYCATRAAVEEVCELLTSRGFSATRYHAGLSDDERRQNQDDLLYDRARIMVATNAFGMGIDKSNVRYVVHYNMPKDIESYYQEAGRAGRDGDPAHCLLLYSGQDVRTAQYLIENKREAAEDLKAADAQKEQDHRRLKIMTYYCHTTDCLRGYILRYFGENPKGSCGECGSCLSNFEEVDITVTGQKILSCVKRMGERYGAGLVIDVLRGGKNARIAKLGLDKLTTYGICEEPELQLREIINQLVLAGYLRVSDDQYPVLALGKDAAGLLRGQVQVRVKLPKPAEKKERGPRLPKTRKGGRDSLVHPIDEGLFAALRTLRAEIARTQGVPAFVVFADSTLTDMCVKMPTTEGEMLTVSGVGKVKMERYGADFLRVISEWGESGARPLPLQDVSPRLMRAEDVELTDEPVTINVIADRVSCVLVRHGVKKITGAKLNQWLVEQGYLRLQKREDGRSDKVATNRGQEAGITSIDLESPQGTAYTRTLYDRQAQQLVAEEVIRLISEND